MPVSRATSLLVGGSTIPLPCFFPSVSSVKTNLLPVDYIELLDAASHPLYLISAYDIATSSPPHQKRIRSALERSRSKSSVTLMDSGNYEGFWKGDTDWKREDFHEIICTHSHDLAFCYDNQNPPETVEAISEEVVNGVLCDQDYAIGSVVPIIHGSSDLLPVVSQEVARHLYPVLLAVPERALGEGIVTRTRSVYRIRQALDALGFYCPLHLLGTGNPISIIAYTMAGADTFDGLEWCQTVVDHETAQLLHFQQWDFVRNQTEWGTNSRLPYLQSALMHNLNFYSSFMHRLQISVENGICHDFLATYLPLERADLICNAAAGGI